MDASNGIWVSDAGNNVLLHFTLPELPTMVPSTVLPIYPPSNVTLVYNAETGMLYTPDGLAVYVLDPAAGQWVPIVPLDIMSQLPAGTLPVKDSTNIWTLYDANQTAVFRWDYASMQWLPVQ
jgi:hypothetical protein